MTDNALCWLLPFFWAGVRMSDWRDFIYFHMFFMLCILSKVLAIIHEWSSRKWESKEITFLIWPSSSSGKQWNRKTSELIRLLAACPARKLKTKSESWDISALKLSQMRFSQTTEFITYWFAASEFLQGDGYSGRRGLTGVLLRSGFSAVRPVSQPFHPQACSVPTPLHPPNICKSLNLSGPDLTDSAELC